MSKERDRISINVLMEHYNKITEIADKMQQPRNSIVDEMMKYALERVTVRQSVELIFNDEPSTVLHTANGKTVEPDEDNDGFRSVSERYPKGIAPYSEIIARLKKMMEDGPVTSIQMRSMYRQKYRTDPGNIQMVLDPSIRHGDVLVDKTVTPYKYSLPETPPAEESQD